MRHTKALAAMQQSKLVVTGQKALHEQMTNTIGWTGFVTWITTDLHHRRVKRSCSTVYVRDVHRGKRDATNFIGDAAVSDRVPVFTLRMVPGGYRTLPWATVTPGSLEKAKAPWSGKGKVALKRVVTHQKAVSEPRAVSAQIYTVDFVLVLKQTVAEYQKTL